MPNFLEQISKLTRQLLPTGRAFGNKLNGVNQKLFEATDKNIALLNSDAYSVLDSILPDNDGFSADDATRWEQRLGMITNTAVSLADRKLAIIRKMNHPGTILARQSVDYLQDRLQAAGFDVYVHENGGLSIENVLTANNTSTQLNQNQLGNFQLSNIYSYYSGLLEVVKIGQLNLGQFNLGQSFSNNVIANQIDETLDAPFYLGGNISRTFFIGGSTLGTFADVDINRKEEFRQLVLRLKPVKSVGYLLINYI